MPTYADLKQFIIADMTRDDLEDDLSALLDMHVANACEAYANERFWFNSALATAVTTSGNPLVALPATIRVAERVTIPTSRRDLLPMSSLPEDTAQGEPIYFSAFNEDIRLYPTPNAALTLNVYGIARIAAPTADNDSNIWTNEARQLIASHVRMSLYRDKFRDLEAAQAAAAARNDALTYLQRETGKRTKAPLVTEFGARRLDCW